MWISLFTFQINYMILGGLELQSSPCVFCVFSPSAWLPVHVRLCCQKHFIVNIFYCVPDMETYPVNAEYLVPGDLISIPKHGCVMPCDALLLNGNCIVNAVSYTHLDVYKRQIVHCTICCYSM